jgi:hypothetical protein
MHYVKHKEIHMAHITLTGTVSPDGILTAHVPATVLPGMHQIVVIVNDEATDDWPPGYFEATAGSIPETDLERGPQGSYEQREELP